MRRSLRSLLPPLLPALALLSLAACAEGPPARQVATMTPLELRGHVVLNRDGTRELGEVQDIVPGTDGRPAAVLVSLGAPMYPTERWVTVEADRFRFSRERNGVVLTGMTAEQFAALPTTTDENALALGGAYRIGDGRAPTDWSGVTPPR